MKFFQAILLVASIVLFLFIINPKKPVIEDLKTKRDDFVVVKGHGEKLKETKDKLIKRFKNIPAEEAGRLRNFLPDTVDNVRLLVDIDAIAKRKRLDITNIVINTQEAIQEDEGGGGVGTVSISFTFISRYAPLKEILLELEQSLRVVDVRDIAVSTTPGSNAFGATLTVDTYWLR